MNDFVHLENTDNLCGYLENEAKTPQKRQNTLKPTTEVPRLNIL